MDEDSYEIIIRIMTERGRNPRDVDDLLYKMDVLADRVGHRLVKERHLRVFGSKLTLMITISFNQALGETEAVVEMRKCISLLKESNYKWLENAVYCQEFYSDEDSHWNPHIHIVTEQNDAPSIVTKAVQRGPCFKKTDTYNVNVVKGNDSYHYQYIEGDKTKSKETNVMKDIEFRKKHNLKSYYSI